MNINLNTKEFDNVIASNKSVLLDFYADWCGPCQALSPTVHKLAEEFEGEVSIRKVNVDENKRLAASFGIRSIPTLVYLSEGKEVDRSNGLTSENELRLKIKQLQSA